MTVTVYSTTTCPFCTMVKDWLKDKGVSYDDVNVGTDKDKAKEMMDKSGQMGVPVIDIQGTVVIGFDKPKLESALKDKGLTQ
ncbi:MAG: NrdH-redoxin [Candidatus Diapherotrites archaeon]|jgi:glutaredoxin 3|nr:NrdH-redoxin [Candidatus Diapherotrites archaeon]MBT4597149.1 NrdH-redoxin [Candidatus Diapherotrites archaeon]